MTLKTGRELRPGDRTKTTDGDLAEIISSKRATWIRHADGPSFDVQWRIISGPNKDATGYYIAGPDEAIEVLS